MAVLLSPSAVGRDYFVSDRGNDGNAGTRSMPWRTVGKASLTPLEPGDRVLFRGGRTFRGNLFVRARRESGIQPIVIGTYENGRAIIHAGDSTAISILDTGGVIVRNLILRGSGAKSNVGTGLEILNTACVDSKLPDVTVENLEASGFRWAGIYVGGPLREGQRCGSAGQAGFRHIRIIRCVTHHNIYYGIHVGGRWDPKPRSYANQDLVIADSIAHHNEGDPHNFKFHSGSGILVEDTAGAIIERCTAYANGARCASRSGGPVGIWAHNATRVMIRYCVSYRNRTGGAADGGGFDFDGGVSNSVMQRNRS